MSITNEIRSGTFYTFIFKYSEIFSQIIITAVLARLLTPKEFGVVAIVTVFTNFFYILSDSGLSVAVIQKRSFSNKEFFSLFILTFFLGISIATIFYFSGYLIADFYNNTVYVNISALLSISLFFNTINTVPAAILLRQKKFKEIGIRKVTVQIVTGIFAIYLAYNNFSYYSIIYRSILVSILIFLFNLKLSGLKFTRNIRLNVYKEILGYSVYQFLFSVVNYFSRNSDNLLVGKVLGPASLGFYDRAYKLMLLPIGSLTQVITPVLHPVLAVHQDKPELIYNVYTKLVKFLALIGFPISIFLYFSAREIVLLLYGKQWNATIPAFKFLALTVGIQMVLVSSGSIFQALGRTDYLFSAGVFSSIITITAVLTGIFVGKSIYAVAFLLIIAFIINFIQGYYLLFVKLFKKRLIELLKLLYPSLIIAFLVLVGNLLFAVFFQMESLFISLIVKVILFLLIYFGMLVLLKEHKLLFSLLFPGKNSDSES